MKINYLKPELECANLCVEDSSICNVSYGTPGSAGNNLDENPEYTYEL